MTLHDSLLMCEESPLSLSSHTSFMRFLVPGCVPARRVPRNTFESYSGDAVPLSRAPCLPFVFESSVHTIFDGYPSVRPCSCIARYFCQVSNAKFQRMTPPAIIASTLPLQLLPKISSLVSFLRHTSKFSRSRHLMPSRKHVSPHTVLRGSRCE